MDDRPSFHGATWHSTACNGGACVRVARQGHWIAIGDSKNLDGGTIVVPLSVWDELIDAVKAGRIRRP